MPFRLWTLTNQFCFVVRYDFREWTSLKFLMNWHFRRRIGASFFYYYFFRWFGHKIMMLRLKGSKTERIECDWNGLSGRNSYRLSWLACSWDKKLAKRFPGNYSNAAETLDLCERAARDALNDSRRHLTCYMCHPWNETNVDEALTVPETFQCTPIAVQNGQLM